MHRRQRVRRLYGGRALAPGAQYLDVFRFVGTVAFACYAMSLPQASIWYKRDWGTTIELMIDGLVYGLLTAGTFGWLGRGRSVGGRHAASAGSKRDDVGT